MSKRVLFNGAVLVRPGAATKIDASQFEDIALSGIGIVGLIGAADGGPPREVTVHLSAASVKATYRSGDLVEAAAILQDPGNDPRVPGGASAIVCYKVNNSVQSTLTVGAHVFKSKQYGAFTNAISIAIAAGSGTERILTIKDIDENGNEVTEISPALAGTGKFTLLYTGAGTSPTVTINATTLSTSITGAAADQVTLAFSDYPTLAKLLAALPPVYTVVPLISNTGEFLSADLDAVTTQSISSAYTVKATNYDVGDWITKNSNIISDTVTKGQAAGPAVTAETQFASGAKGSSANSDWVTGLDKLGGLRINQVVPLVSADGASPDTFTFSSILASAVAHAKFYSATSGRSERHVFAGAKQTLTDIKTTSATHNSEHLTLFAQEIDRVSAVSGTVTTLPAWATACVAAGMRAGATLGEPLTWKYINALAVRSDSSWSYEDNDDLIDLTLNGVTPVVPVRGAGYKFDKVITTYGKTDNDAYSEETVVQIWKAVAYELRKALEDRFVGRPGNVNVVAMVPSIVAGVCELFRTEGALTDSIENGTTIPAYRNIKVALDGDVMNVSVTISPTPGINFILNTIALVPASISV